jgi:hypothetical protein
VPVATFSRYQVGPITVATGADAFTEHVATVIFIATKGHSSDDTVLKFSPTLPTRTHAHQLLNTRQSKVFKDLKHSVPHTVLLAWARRVAISTHTCAYVCVTTGMSRAGARSILWRIFYGQSFLCKVKGINF